jgi:hypothetical protein
MKTMYRAEVAVYESIEGYRSKYIIEGNYVKTIEEAKEICKNVKRDIMTEGSYRVIEVTMDEETFTYTEKVVYTFDYYERVYRPQNLQKKVTYWKTELEELQGKLTRAKSEKSIAKYTKQIEKAEVELIEATERLENCIKELEKAD